MRPPDLIIGPRDNPYLLRWHLFRWRGWQLALHHMLRDDDDRALHDHRGDNISIVLRGGYLEWFSHRGEPVNCVWRKPGSIIFRKAETPHRLTLGYASDGRTQRPSWSIWLRWPSRREWGFYCPKGWVQWQKFCASPDYSKPGSTSEIGPGCD